MALLCELRVLGSTGTERAERTLVWHLEFSPLGKVLWIASHVELPRDRPGGHRAPAVTCLDRLRPRLAAAG